MSGYSDHLTRGINDQKTFKINSESDITKCSVCHKTETWDIQKQFCSTCCDIERHPVVSRFVSDDIQVKSNIKKEMQEIFISTVLACRGKFLNRTREQIHEMDSAQIWSLHQALMIYFYKKNHRSVLMLESRLFNIALLISVAEFLALVCYTEKFDYFIANLGPLNIFVLILVPVASFMLPFFLVVRSRKTDSYITKYREFEKLYGKNARFF